MVGVTWISGILVDLVGHGLCIVFIGKGAHAVVRLPVMCRHRVLLAETSGEK